MTDFETAPLSRPTTNPATNPGTGFVDTTSLAAALPFVLAAPQTDGPIRLLCTRPARN